MIFGFPLFRLLFPRAFPCGFSGRFWKGYFLYAEMTHLMEPNTTHEVLNERHLSFTLLGE